MGKVISKVVSFVASKAVGAKFLGLTGPWAIFAQLAVSIAISGLSKALSPKPKKLGAAKTFSQQASSQNLSFRQPVTSRKVIYGEVRTSGPLVAVGSSASNKYLHMVVVLASHECEAIDEIWLDDDVIANDMLNGSGMVTSGKYSGKVRIKKYLGIDGQNADPDLVAELPGWTSNHRGRGICYLAIRLELDRTLFPNGAPNPSAIVRGKKIFDSRTGMAAWTPNAGLLAYDYLTDTRFGIGADAGDVGTSETEAAANASEEIVATQNIDAVVSSIDTGTDVITVSGSILQMQRGDCVEILTTGSAPGGLATATDYYLIPYQFKGTVRVKLAASLADALTSTAIDITSAGSGTHTIRKTGEPRYFGGGVVDTEQAQGENLRDILSAMAGKVTNTGGEWKLFAGVYRAPTVTLDETHLRAPISVTTRRPRAERFNAVKGIYVSPANNWQPADYPLVSVSTHVDADGEQILTDLDLPFTQRASTAQRIAQIHLNKHRQEISLPYPTNLHGLQFQPCDTVSIDNTRMGWDGKPFEVDVWKLSVEEEDGVPRLVVDMMLSETAAGVYSWDSADELLVDPAPNTSLPDVGTVSAIVGLAVDSIAVETEGGDNTFRVVAQWAEHDDSFVIQRGSIEVEYKLSASSTWLQLPRLPGYATRADIFTAALGTLYDLRVRALNYRGIPSSWNTLEGLSVGSGGGVGSTEDWGSTATVPADTTEDWGSTATVPADTTEDWGTVT